MVTQTRIKSGEYHDSVTLLSLSQQLSQTLGVLDNAVVMGTPANKDLLQSAGLLTDQAKQASPNDLVIVIKGTEEKHVSTAFDLVDELLTAKHALSDTADSQPIPRTLDAALERIPDSNIVLISVAGQYATSIAFDALNNNQNVFLFSDNISLEDEIELKKQARARELFVMGPDAGTAIINGVALGFANQVMQGPVGIVAASGTGLQYISSALTRKGIGVSQAIGVGGRDLTKDVGGIMMIQSFHALITDPKTEVIVLVSKPPSTKVAKKILKIVSSSPKPTVVCFLGSKVGSILASGGIPALTLEEATQFAVALAQGRKTDTVLTKLDKQRKKLKRYAADLKTVLDKNQKYYRGLFSGGTFCYETQLILGEMLGIKKIRSNAPLSDKQKAYRASISKGHMAIDLGADEFTVGRLHPMLDPALRNRMLLQHALQPQTAVIYIDVVLGYGVHPDPAGAVIPAIIEAKNELERLGRKVIFMASVCGTSDDPQNVGLQEQKLQDAGVIVVDANANAAYLAGYILSS